MAPLSLKYFQPDCSYSVRRCRLSNRDPALYYDSAGRLIYALWDSWEVDAKTGLPDMQTYARSRAVEFRYEDADARRRYLMRALDPDLLPAIVPLANEAGMWTECDAPGGGPRLTSVIQVPMLTSSGQITAPCTRTFTSGGLSGVSHGEVCRGASPDELDNYDPEGPLA